MTLSYRTWLSHPWLKSAAGIGFIVATLLGIITMQRSRLANPSQWVSDPVLAEQQERVRLQLLKQVPSFGFDNLLADWTFLNYLQYYGDEEARSQTGYALAPDYFDAITQRDPRFVDIYLFLSGTLSYQLGKPEQAVALIDRGIASLSPQVNPDAFQLWRLKGLDQLLLLGDTTGSAQSHDMAAQWTEGTPNASLAPTFRRTADFLRRDPNSKLLRLEAWGSVFAGAIAANDRSTQTRAQKEIQALGGNISVENGRIKLVAPPPEPNPKK
jgi:hypothetical protein